MKKTSISVLLVAVLVTLGFTQASAAPFVPTGFAPNSDRQAVAIEDLPDGPEWISIITKQIPFTAENPETEANPVMCRSLTTNGCALDGSINIGGTSILPLCEGSANNCIEGLKITKPDGEVVEAKFLKAVAGFRFDGSPEYGIPAGETPSIWVAEGAKNTADSEKYVVNVSLGWEFRNSKPAIRNMTARVIAIKDVNGSAFRPSQIMYHINPNTGKFQSNHDNGEQGGLDKCAATDVGYCAEKVDFTPGTRADLTLRVTNKVTGWLHGRLSQPQILVTPIDANYNRIAIAGASVVVPTMYAEFERSKMTTSFLDYFRYQYSLGGFNGRSTWYRFSSSAEKSRDVITTLAASAKDTSSGTISYWSVKSIPSENSNNKCLQDKSKLVGLVTTNAMAYSGAAPKWSGGSLRYEVAGLHYMPDGKTLTEGTYDLAIRSDVARCLYGFSNAPISATISVISDAGQAKVATTVVRESAGWLTLRAAGFTFSAPTISIKLTQPKGKVSTIVCAKGSVIKKVTAKNAKCPVGYKAK